MDKDAPPPGLVAGKYRLTQLIGRGGMGSVWEGTHVTLGTAVAVKFIDAEYAESPEARNRFDNEARAAAKLRSKHVVEVYDHGVTEDGRPFIVMEFLRGEPLDRRLDRIGRLPAKETARIVMQVCRALARAHAAGIVHRDLKPENVFLVWDEEDGADVAKVVDFGIAKFTDNQLGNSSATRTGSVLGTPYYMSPEQARGLRSVDYRSDLWSVGVIAYRCIMGTLPFDGEAVGDLLVKLCTAPLPIPSQLQPDVPPAFDAWFARALSREPEGRFANASELAEALANVCGVPVRVAYSTADIPIPSFAGGPSATSSPAITPAPALLHGTPYPADRSGPHPAIGIPIGSTLQMATGAPTTTQTPKPASSKNTGTIVASAAAAVVVLGIGAAVLVKLLAPAPPPEVTPAVAAPPAEVKPAEPKLAEPSVAETPPTPPVVAPPVAPPSAAPSTANVPSATVKPVRPPPNVPVRPPQGRPGGASGPDVIGF